MYKILRSVLFLFDAERAHYVAASLLHFILRVPGVNIFWNRLYCVTDKRLETNVFGLHFPNPVGLAAGFDKNASMYNDLAHCGFGFIEIGTVTPKPQDGNEKPRLFRLKSDEAIINRMGFNNDGLEVVVRNLKKKHNNTLIIGGNIGKNKITPNEDAVTDYLLCFDALFPYVDYFVVNVSSPNTPNLRELQEKEPLMKLLSALVLKNNARDKPKPILLKIAPDLTNSQLDDIIDIVRQTRIDGIVATNTTISRDGLLAPPLKLQSIGAGGLSGKPLVARSTEVIRYISEKSAGSIPIIGVGGIHSPKDAIDKIEAGASLVQLYTGFVYEGPGIIKRINQEILRMRK